MKFIIIALFSFSSFAFQIIGSDDRVQIKDTSKSYYQSIGMVQRGCSGTLISSKHVLTNAHCIFDKEKNEITTQLNFHHAISSSKETTKKSYRWKKAYFLKDYKSKELDVHEYDFALIELEDEVVGYKNIIKLSTNYIADKYMFAGYPDKNGQRYNLWESTCDWAIKKKAALDYECDSTPGTSGAGVIVKRDNQLYLVAVHVGSFEKKNSTENEQSNYNVNRGAIVDSFMLNTLKNWLNNQNLETSVVIEDQSKYWFIFKAKESCKEDIKLEVYKSDKTIKTYKLSPSNPVEVENNIPHIFYRGSMQGGHFSGKYMLDDKEKGFRKLSLNKNIYTNVTMRLGCQ